MKRKILILFLAVAVATGTAFAHGGKTHRLLGTVKQLHQDHLVVVTPNGHETTVQLTEDTRYEKGKKKATRSELVAGVRVSIQLTEDDKSAVTVKIGVAPAK